MPALSTPNCDYCLSEWESEGRSLAQGRGVGEVEEATLQSLVYLLLPKWKAPESLPEPSLGMEGMTDDEAA